MPMKCWRCDGTGKVEVGQERLSAFSVRVKLGPCEVCKGTGKVEKPTKATMPTPVAIVEATEFTDERLGITVGAAWAPHGGLQ